MAKSANNTSNSPIQEFIHSESASGIFLIIAAVLALIWANTPAAGFYTAMLQVPVQLGFGALLIDKPLILWVNDGLMAIFFLLVGLEIKRELIYGELSTFKAAMLPLFAAIGGVVVPAAIYIAMNGGTEFEAGWAIPMATDIAFALGILSLLGSRVPVWAKVFLTALAIVDDLMAILVIAVFYTAKISFAALGWSFFFFAVLIVLNMFRVNRLAPYMIIGFFMWVAMLKSGVHATIAGVMLGFAIPVARSSFLKDMVDGLKRQIANLESSIKHDKGEHPADEVKETALNYFSDVVVKTESPLHRLEHKLHPWVAFFIMPVFALFNAGVTFNAAMLSEAFGSTLTWGIILGLFVGKQIGIFAFTFVAQKLGFSSFEANATNQKILYGLGLLGGIGFTMSLFIANLAFSDPAVLDFARIGIFVASFFSAVIGYTILRSVPETKESRA